MKNFHNVFNENAKCPLCDHSLLTKIGDKYNCTVCDIIIKKHHVSFDYEDYFIIFSINTESNKHNLFITKHDQLVSVLPSRKIDFEFTIDSKFINIEKFPFIDENLLNKIIDNLEFT